MDKLTRTCCLCGREVSSAYEVTIGIKKRLQSHPALKGKEDYVCLECLGKLIEGLSLDDFYYLSVGDADIILEGENQFIAPAVRTLRNAFYYDVEEITAKGTIYSDTGTACLRWKVTFWWEDVDSGQQEKDDKN